ncbi:UDP-glucose dehydrogenase family protein [Alistipes shahii]|jgi:UDPglucose 6-dehydrogenase|uniref:UDP-glucose dehydrogenase family protein n=1 Tax=Alistipes shahii TaxID=328814 RepID=UPI004026FC3E
MKIIVIGSGYVGLVTGACLSETGIDVCCVDTDAAKIAFLGQGKVPIYEPGLQEIVERNIRTGRLHFTTDVSACIGGADVVFIAVGTPPDQDGSADTHSVIEVARTIGRTITGYTVVAVKSTVPVGTTQQVGTEIRKELHKRNASIEFDVVSNPEFLKEGRAVSDFMTPDRVVVGAESTRAERTMELLYKPFMMTRNRMLFTDIATAEMIKYAANAMLATRISFMNEMANLCERVGADIDNVRRGIGADPRIGAKFLYAGCGYGGSCFPKDVRALIATADRFGYPMPLLRAVDRINEAQKEIPFRKLKDHFDGHLENRTIAVWGLSFKPDTDDIREAPALVVIERLLKAGCRVKAYDPAATETVRKKLGDKILLADDMYAAAEGADSLVVMTEWRQFRHPDWLRLLGVMRHPVLIDGRNIYDRGMLIRIGFAYYRIG